MKRIKYFLLTALALTGCSQETPQMGTQPGEVTELPTFKATMDTQQGRATLSGLSVKWQNGDQISVFPKTGDNIKYQLQGEGGNTYGVFDVAESEDISLDGAALNYNGAVYPYNESFTAENIESGLAFNVTIPSQQTYTPNSFDPKASLMVAVSDNNQLDFRNVCSVLKLSLTGKHQVSKIVLTSDKEQKICGPGKVSFVKDYTPKWESDANSSGTTITLYCPDIQLSSTPTDFYFAVAPGSHFYGLTVSVFDTFNGTMVKETANNLNLEQARIHKMPVLDFEPNYAVLDKGEIFNKALQDVSLDIRKISKITFKTEIFDYDGFVVSAQDSYFPIYMKRGKDETEIEVYTKAKGITLHPESNKFFCNCNSLTEIVGFELCNTLSVLNMDYFFYGCKVLKTYNFSNFNTANVISMNSMFIISCVAQDADFIKHLDTGHVEDMAFMFRESEGEYQLDLRNFDISNVKYMREMFCDSKKLTSIDISSFKFNSHTDCRYIFGDLALCIEAGADLILPDEICNLEEPFYDDMFSFARLRSITCSKKVYDWIFDNKWDNGWVKANLIEFKFILTD